MASLPSCAQPNLTPPIITTAHALSYQAHLQSLAPKTTFLMTLYLHPSITPAEIQTASKAGIRGVKSYPRGVTTNSDGGIENYEDYYPVFAEMEKAGMVLNLHGEVPSDSERVSTSNSWQTHPEMRGVKPELTDFRNIVDDRASAC